MRLHGRRSAGGTDSREARRSVSAVVPGMTDETLVAGLEGRAGFEQTGRVGVKRRFEETLRPLLFHDAAGIHDENPVTERRGELEVVRDEQHGQLPFPPQRIEDGHDLGLDRDVEGRRRLVGDEHVRVGGKLGGDHDSLEHAAGELSGIRAKDALSFGDADQLEQLESAHPGDRRGSARHALAAPRSGGRRTSRAGRCARGGPGRSSRLESPALRGARWTEAGEDRRRPGAPLLGSARPRAGGGGSSARSSTCRSPTRRRARGPRSGRSRS